MPASFQFVLLSITSTDMQPSSCGDMRNISYPFRLQDDPRSCGYPEYELICENNRTMINLHGGTYLVTQINYQNYTIRVVDPRRKKDNCWISSPLNSIVNQGRQLPHIIPCNTRGSSSSSPTYAYAVVGDYVSLSFLPLFCHRQCEMIGKDCYDINFTGNVGFECKSWADLTGNTPEKNGLQEELSKCEFYYPCNTSMIGGWILRIIGCAVNFKLILLCLTVQSKINLDNCSNKNIGGVSYKADVYSFGNVVNGDGGEKKECECKCKRTRSQIYFPSWIYDRYDQGDNIDLGDATEDEKKLVRKMVIVALWCIQMKPIDRPSMSKALEMLEGEVELLEMPPKPTLYSEEMLVEDHMSNPIEAPISLCNSMGTITLDGR
ncbi:Rust resistance kinase Lr10 [Vitis vinifera]|uniref:Rust resistance kinase Lr10 n=1 Tax=Vitis vinifera TaxID=29760 RepID=A0A438C6U5_VITVI|nr:Rust resistance kinase Lr10 [Vitis vinifera]